MKEIVADAAGVQQDSYQQIQWLLNQINSISWAVGAVDKFMDSKNVLLI